MLNQPTIDKLCAMRMRGMAEALQQQMQEPDIHQLSFEERLGLLIDRQWDWRQNRALERRLRNARLQGPACVEDSFRRSSINQNCATERLRATRRLAEHSRQAKVTSPRHRRRRLLETRT